MVASLARLCIQHVDRAVQSPHARQGRRDLQAALLDDLPPEQLPGHAWLPAVGCARLDAVQVHVLLKRLGSHVQSVAREGLRAGRQAARGSPVQQRRGPATCARHDQPPRTRLTTQPTRRPALSPATTRSPRDATASLPLVDTSHTRWPACAVELAVGERLQYSQGPGAHGAAVQRAQVECARNRTRLPCPLAGDSFGLRAASRLGAGCCTTCPAGC